MKTLSNNFSTFLNRASVNGYINYFMVSFADDSISMRANSNDNVMVSSTKMKTTAFTEYEKGWELGIKDAVMLSKKFSSITNGVCEMQVQEGSLVVNDSTESMFDDRLGTDETINNTYDLAKFNSLLEKFQEPVRVEFADVKRMINVMDIMKSDVAILSITDNKMSLTSPNRIDEKARITFHASGNNVEVKFNAELLKSVLRNIPETGAYLQFMGDAQPMLIRTEADLIEQNLVIAPIVED